MLTSAAREVLRAVEHVIIDEVHAIAGTKRGRPPALSASSAWSASAAPSAAATPPQRIGLSRDPAPARGDRPVPGRGRARAASVRIVDAGARKPLELQVVVPVDDMAALGRDPPARRAARRPGRPAARPRTSIWPAIHPRILELIREPPQHDRLHQQPPPCRAARPAAQRAGRRGTRPGPPRQHRPRAARSRSRRS